MSNFAQRVHALPHLGIGVSTEYGAFRSDDSLDVESLRREYPEFAGFLEVGVSIDTGLDEDTRRWVEAGRATTYHFLDVNLDYPDDFDPDWLAAVNDTKDILKPAWLCGDAGLWHFGRRDRGHMLLLPPILSLDSAARMADGIMALREATGLEVLPENPPGQVFIGDLHILEFFAAVMERADTGMLLDAAHLAIYQRSMGYGWQTGLDGFPMDRVVEIHVAGAGEFEVEGLPMVEDDHTVEVLPETWQILGLVAPAALHLKALVFECERNPMADCLDGFRRISQQVAETPFGRVRPS